MSNERGNDAAGYLGWFFLGSIAGAATALLLAPKTGRETRELLAERGNEFLKRAQEKAGETQGRAADRFGRRVALVTAVFAVLLAIAALGGNHAMKEMLLAQQKSSDQWAFYQAKVIREHQYRGQKLRLEADLIERGDAMKPAAREKVEALMKKFEEEEQRYNAEKKDIEKDAKKLEHERDVWQARDPYFLFAEALLQIAIVMASVSI